MASRVGLAVGLLLLLCTVAIGAPDDPAEKTVYPLFQEDGQWWAGVGDLCEIAGATLEGEGLAQTIERDGGKFRLRIQAMFGTAGPLKITVGEDVYEIEAGRERVDKNGEHERDFIHQPKRVKGVTCAALEDLCELLGLELGEAEDGQPTVTVEDETYRLVEGERKLPFSFTGDDETQVWRKGDGVIVGPDDFRQYRRAIRVTPGGTGTVELGGATYYQAPGNPFSRTRTMQFYGPVKRGAVGANGARADIMYPTIVEFEQPAGVIAVREQGAEIGEAVRKALEEARRKYLEELPDE